MGFQLPSAARRLALIPCIVYAFCMADPAAAQAPTVFWASDPVKPGQTVQVSGMNLGDIAKVEVTRLGDQSGARTESPPQPATVLEKSESTLSFVLPEGLSAGVFSVRVQTPDGSSSFQLNAPDLYWAQGNKGPAASPGGWIRLSGRNMAVTENAVVALVAPDGKETSLKAAALDLWSASFPLPANLPVGDYRLRLWNGTGDASAWKDGGTIAVEAEAKGDGPIMELLPNRPDSRDHDDTPRINAAMDALHRRGGGTMLLHSGIYRLVGAIRVPDGVHLKGESNELVTLAWKDTDTPPTTLIEGVSDFSVEDLTINAQRHFNIIKGGFDPQSGAPRGTNISVKNVIIRATGLMGHLKKGEAWDRVELMKRTVKDGVVAVLMTGRNIVVENCDVLSSMRPIVLTGATGARVTNNTFRTGRLGWYGIEGSDGVLFEDNRIIGADLEATGGGINTLDGSNSVRNILVRNNHFESIYGWDREAMTSDGPRGYYRGRFVALPGRSVQIDPAGLGQFKDRDWKGVSLFVLKGRGLGAIAHVVSRNGNVVELDRDIAGLTDDSSVVTIVPTQENYLIIGNSFEDTGAAQIFGTGYKHIFAGNKAVRSYGFVATSLDYLHPQPNFYIQFLDNEARSVPLLSNAGINVTGRQYEGNDTILTFGAVIRQNRLRGGLSIWVNGRSEVTSVRNVLIEQNQIDHSDIGINIGKGVDHLTIRDNLTRDVQVPLKQPSH